MAHKEIAKNLGMKNNSIFILENGQILNLTRRRAEISKETVPAEDILVDGLGVGDVGNIVLRDRRLLSESGLIIVVAAIDRERNVVSGPDIISRGFVYVRENEDLIEDARSLVEKTLNNCRSRNTRDWTAMKSMVRDSLRTFIYEKTKRNPVILPIFLEV